MKVAGFGMKVAGVLALANVTMKGANFWGLERRKNVVPIRSTFKVCALIHLCVLCDMQLNV